MTDETGATDMTPDAEPAAKADPAPATATKDAPAAHPGRGRRIGVQVLIWGTTVLAIVGIFAVWANRQMFNPDNWANTSTQLLQNKTIRNATANYLVDQLYANVDVAGEIKAKLPKQLQPLAAPAAGPKNLLINPGFEKTATNSAWMPAAWDTSESGVPTVFFGRDTVGAHSGRWCVNIANMSTWIPVVHYWGQEVVVGRAEWGREAVLRLLAALPVPAPLPEAE